MSHRQQPIDENAGARCNPKDFILLHSGCRPTDAAAYFQSVQRYLRPASPTFYLFHHERKPFLSRAQAIFIVSANLFCRDKNWRK